MKRILKNVLKALVIIIALLMVIPYFITTSFPSEIPSLPYENSVFYNTEDNVTLHTQVYEPEGEPVGKILMIHGLGASTYSFSTNAPFLLENGYYVVSVDLPAFGYSSKEQGINHSQIENAKRLWELLDNHDIKLESNEPWSIVGHSMGGSASLAMVNQNPERIQSLILFSPAITQASSNFSWVFRSPIGQWLKVFLRYNIIREDRIKSFLKSIYNGEPTQQDITGYLTPLQISTTPQALLDFVVTSENVQITDLVPQDIDIHLIWGENDNIVPPEQIKVIQDNYSIASLTILKDGGHLVHEKDPLANQIMLDILRNTP